MSETAPTGLSNPSEEVPGIWRTLLSPEHLVSKMRTCTPIIVYSIPSESLHVQFYQPSVLYKESLRAQSISDIHR